MSPENKGGKIGLPLMIGGAVLLFIILFGIGLALRIAVPGLLGQSGEEEANISTTLSFESVFTGPGDYGLLQIDLHLSSKQVAAMLNENDRSDTVRLLRRAADNVFRTSGASAFRPNEDALEPSKRARDRLASAMEAQLRSISPELRAHEGALILAVTLYYQED